MSTPSNDLNDFINSLTNINNKLIDAPIVSTNLIGNAPPFYANSPLDFDFTALGNIIATTSGLNFNISQLLSGYISGVNQNKLPTDFNTFLSGLLTSIASQNNNDPNFGGNPIQITATYVDTNGVTRSTIPALTLGSTNYPNLDQAAIAAATATITQSFETAYLHNTVPDLGNPNNLNQATLTGGDWSALESQNSGTDGLATPSIIEAQFAASWAAFATTFNDSPSLSSSNTSSLLYIYNHIATLPDNMLPGNNSTNGQNIPDFALGFFTALRTFQATTATIKSGSPIYLSGPGFTTFNASGISNTIIVPSYEQVFETLLPLSSFSSTQDQQNNFNQALQTFYKNTVKAKGYFNTSQDLSAWVTYVQSLQAYNANHPPFVSTVGLVLPQTSTNVLNNVLSLLISLIQALQNVAASQANRLNLYSSWQRGYTDILNQVHTFTGQSGDLLADGAQHGGTGGIHSLATSSLGKVRTDAQANFNAQLTQKITANKDVVASDAKSLQSNVNSSSDAFNQQANAATAILQELSTILSTIFH